MLVWLEQLLQDLRFGARTLAKSPGFTAIAVFSLALGIMATAAIYSVIYAVVLHPFIYKNVDRLMSVKIWEPGARGWRTGYSTDQFLEIAERNTIFEGVIASTISDVVWTGEGEPQRLRGNYGTFNTFEVMGVPPIVGRTFSSADAAADATPVCVLGYKFWQRQFGGDPNVIGRQLRLNDRFHTVVGVMPRRFMWRGADVYVPFVPRRGQVVQGVRFVHLLGRLKPGVTEAQAEADLRPIIEELKRREPGQFPEKWRVGLLSFKETFPSGIRDALWILFGAVGLLLLIACVNVSNLLLSKAASRQKEMAVRAALGAGRVRLIRQLLTESLLLALAGCALGVGLAFAGLQAIIAIVPPGTIPDESVIAINTPVLLFTVGVSALSTLLFGLVPAIHAARLRVAAASRLRVSPSGVLVVAEVALSLMLLAGASLMIRTLIKMQSVDLGIRADRLLTMRIPLNEQRYPDLDRRVAFLQNLLPRVAAVPGVLAVGLNVGLHPFGGWRMPVEMIGNTQQDQRPVLVHQTNPGYTKAFGIALLQGRLFTESEVAAKQHLALVNQAFGRQYAAGESTLGRVVRIPRLRGAPFRIADASFQIVGVVKDTLNRSLTNEISPEIYLPFTITGLADELVVLTQTAPASVTGAVRSQVYAVDKDQPVTEVRTIDALLNEWVFAEPRFNLALFAVFAGLGLVLAVIGVYGVISHSVAQQTQEIGVRIALGATLGNIMGMVLGRGLKLLAAGIALGLIGALSTTRLLEKQIWKVSPFDPLSFVAVSIILLLVGLQACFWPAGRAARVDPVTALRYE